VLANSTDARGEIFYCAGKQTRQEDRFMKKHLSRLVPLVGACAMLTLALGGVADADGVPELDPGAASSGVALLVGGALLLIERYRRRR
jgi:hypothetical protein